LAFSRKQVLQRKVLSLASVVDHIAPVLHRVIREDIDIVVARRGGDTWVKADQTQLEQVILNLAVNARDAMPHGGTLTIETCAVELDDTFARVHPGARAGFYVVLSATDTGHGMDRETQTRVFEPFFTTKEAGHGTGLGLATVYGIVKQHDGYIEVESALGSGTTFRVYLPRVEAPPPAPEPEAEPAPPAAGAETILLVEDEPEVRDLTAEILRDAGYQMLTAAGPAAALQISAAFRGTIHLLLTDVVMPAMGGRELADRIAVARPDTAVLYMSGYTDEALGHRGMLAPGVRLLAKPFTPNELRHAVRASLDTRQGGEAPLRAG
jgi:CheY-like chemotaxis protein